MEVNKAFIAKRMKQVLEEKHVSVYRLEKESGLSRSTITCLMSEKDTKMPSVFTLGAALKVVDYSFSDFFRNDGARQELSDEEAYLVECYRKCNSEGRAHVQGYAKGIMDMCAKEKH